MNQYLNEYSEQADIYASQGDIRKALEFHKKSISVDEFDGGAHFNLAYCFLAHNLGCSSWKEALKHSELAIYYHRIDLIDADFFTVLYTLYAYEDKQNDFLRDGKGGYSGVGPTEPITRSFVSEWKKRIGQKHGQSERSILTSLSDFGFYPF